MFKIILIPILILIVFSCDTQQKYFKRQETLELNVKLITNIDSIQLPSFCGSTSWNMTFEFEIIEVLKGTYPYKTISINIKCPREAVLNKWLTTGKAYQYRVVKRFECKTIKVGEECEKQELDDYEIVY